MSAQGEDDVKVHGSNNIPKHVFVTVLRWILIQRHFSKPPQLPRSGWGAFVNRGPVVTILHCISVAGWHGRRQGDQERRRREAGQGECFHSLLYNQKWRVSSAAHCCSLLFVPPGVPRSLHGDERQDGSQRRAGLHCCGQVWNHY